MSTQPTDDELNALANACTPNTETGSLNYRKFARAVLERWCPPATGEEPAGRVVSAQCEYATVQWLRQTSPAGGGDPRNSRSWPITGDAIYTSPQPVRKPLTDAQIKGLIEEGVFFGNCKEIVRAIEAAHGIGIAGGRHSTSCGLLSQEPNDGA